MPTWPLPQGDITKPALLSLSPWEWDLSHSRPLSPLENRNFVPRAGTQVLRTCLHKPERLGVGVLVDICQALGPSDEQVSPGSGGGHSLRCLQVLSEAVAELCEMKHSIYANKNTHLVDA